MQTSPVYKTIGLEQKDRQSVRVAPGKYHKERSGLLSPGGALGELGQGFPEKATSELGVESEQCCLEMSGIWA